MVCAAYTCCATPQAREALEAALVLLQADGSTPAFQPVTSSAATAVAASATKPPVPAAAPVVPDAAISLAVEGQEAAREHATLAAQVRPCTAPHRSSTHVINAKTCTGSFGADCACH